MENFILAMNVVLPILIILTIGYILKYFKMLDTSSLNQMNSLVFRVFMSSLLFINIYRLEAEVVFQKKNLHFISCFWGPFYDLTELFRIFQINQRF